MTLPEMPTTPRKCVQNTMALGCALREMLTQAQMEGRVTCGVFECAKLLEISPDNIMMCILPKDTNCNDVTSHIQQTLIEAFCWENDIRLLMVENISGLESSLNTNMWQQTTDINLNRIQTTPSDYSCVLVQNPEEDYTQADLSVFHHYHNLSFSDGFPTSPVKIPTD